MNTAANPLMLRDRIALVTGGGHGIGREIALAFAGAGADVVLCGTREDALVATAADVRALGRRALARVTDVSDEAAVTALAAAAHEAFGRIDVLVNNAGISGPTAPVDEVSRADWDHTLAVNLTGAFLCARAVLPGMAQRGGGKIVNIASIAGQIGYALRAPYAVSKWGLIGLTKTLAIEWGERNVHVNAISPGPVSGDRIEGVIRSRAARTGVSDDAMRREYTSKTALGRFVTEGDIATTALFLASPAADGITGQVIEVAAGYQLG